MSGEPSNPNDVESQPRTDALIDSERELYIRQNEAENRGYRDAVNFRANAEVRRGCSFKTFSSCNPPTYEGSDDPVVTLNWLRRMEQVFGSCDCEPEYRVRYDVRMLRDSVLWWWDSVNASLDQTGIDRLTWGEFSRKVQEKYCSQYEPQKIEQKFLQLRKGDRSVDKLVRRCNTPLKRKHEVYSTW